MIRPLRNDSKGLLEGFLYGVISTLNNNIKDPQRLLEEARRQIQDLDTSSITLSSNKISSSELNKAIKTLYVWITAIYRAILVEESNSSKANAILENELSNYEQMILKGLKDLKAIQLIKDNNEYNDARVVDFSDGRNLEYSGSRLQVSDKGNYLELPVLSRNDYSNFIGEKDSLVSVSYSSPNVTVLKNKKSPVSAILDKDPRTSWIETVLSDYKLTHDESGTIYTGVGSIVTIDYQNIRLVNEINIKPSSEFKPRLIKLEYSSDGTSWTSVPGFTEPKNPFWWTIKTAPISLRFLKLTLVQENYKETTYHLPYLVHLNQQILDLLSGDNVSLRDVKKSEIENRETEIKTNLLLESLSILDKEIGSIIKRNEASHEIEYLQSLIEPILRFFGTEKSLGTVVKKNRESTVEIHKYVYIIGLAHVDISHKTYHKRGTFISPPYSFRGSLREVVLLSKEEIPTLTDSVGNQVESGTINYSIEIAPNKAVDILPKGASIVHEVVKINPDTRRGYVRFNTSDSNPLVWKDNVLLDSSEYVFTPSTKELKIVDSNLYSPWSIYHIKYVPSSGQDILDLTSVFTPTLLQNPETFAGTDSSGLIKLKYRPYVNYSNINNSTLFSKREGSSVFEYRSSVPQSIIDGEVWGIATSLIQDNPLSDTATTITLSGSDGDYFVAPGIAIIEDEQISFTGKTSNSLTGVTRGINGTKAVSHNQNTVIRSIGRTIYEPISVFVDGVKAINRTDYIKGEHPTTVLGSNQSKVHSYLHINDKLYFGSPIDHTKLIEVRYFTLAQYLKLIVSFQQTVAGNYSFTPVLNEANLLINTSRI